MLFIIQAIIVLLLMICALVAAHELGHYLAARWAGMDVEEFAIGMGRPCWIWRRKGETIFTLRPLPLGGFLRVKGAEPQEDGSEIHIKNGLFSKHPFKRIVMMFAGPFFSILFGTLLLFGIYVMSGINKPINEPILSFVDESSAAFRAGLRTKDKVLKVNGKKVETFYDIIRIAREKSGVPIEFIYERSGETRSAIVTPVIDKVPTPVIGKDLMPTSETKIQGKLGVAYAFGKVKPTLGEAIQAALTAPVQIGKMIGGLFIKPNEAKEQLGSLGTIAIVTAEATKQGLLSVISLAAGLSISLGYANLLPILPLDGGHIVVALIELLRGGKRLSMKVQNGIASVGFAAFLMLVATVLYFDVVRISSGQLFRENKNKIEQKNSSLPEK